MKTRDLRQKKPQQPYFTGDIHSHVRIILRQKMPTLSCITDNKTRTTHIPVALNLEQQPSNKGRKRVIFREPDQSTTPVAYTLNLNTSQQERLRLHEIYAHADMKEIQQRTKKP
jgi:hypothetical protein